MQAALAQFLDHIAYERGLAKNTRRAYAADLHVFTAFLAAQGVQVFNAVTRPQVVAFLEQQRRLGMSVTTLARRLVAIKVLFSYLQAEGLLDKNITEALHAPKLWRNLPGLLSPAEAGRLVESAAGDAPRTVRNRAILELFYGCGLRVSELASLKLDDVQADDGFVRCTGKGNKQRVVPLGACAADAVRRYLAEVRPKLAKHPGEACLILTQQGRGFSRQGLYKMICQAAREAGLSGRVTPHTLRHCFASHLLANGASLRAIQDMLGHASIATTQIYTHVDQDRLIAVHRQFHPRA